MENRCKPALGHGGRDVSALAAKLPGAASLQFQRDGRHLQCDIERSGALERRRERRGIVAGRVRFLEQKFARRNVDRTEASGQTTCAGAWEVDMAFVAAFREFAHRVGTGTGTFPKSMQHVVMPVEYQLHCDLPAGPRQTI